MGDEAPLGFVLAGIFCSSKPGERFDGRPKSASRSGTKTNKIIFSSGIDQSYKTCLYATEAASED